MDEDYCIKIQYLPHYDLEAWGEVKYQTVGSSGFDLRAAIKDTVYSTTGWVVIPTGIRVAIPEGFEIQIRSRSGLAAKFGWFVLNAPGTIDCVVKGTKIKTIEQDACVEDLFDMDTPVPVMSYNEQTNCIEDDIITDMFIAEDVPICTLELTDGAMVSMATTKEVFTSRGWVQCMNLTPNDRVLVY